MSVENSHFQDLMQIYDLSPLINEPTCVQSHNPTCIDNFLTNQKVMFKRSRLFETGLSDHHKLISVVMKPGVFRGPSYKKSNLKHFNIALKSELGKLSNSAYNEFETAFCVVLNKHAPIKVKMLRHNNNSFMTKNLRKAIMHKSKFKNYFNKSRTRENWCNYKTRRNYCISLLRKKKQQYFKNLNVNDVTDNKTYWRTIKPYFNEKG